VARRKNDDCTVSFVTADPAMSGIPFVVATRDGKTWRVAKRPGSIMGANTVLYRMLDRDTTIIILGNTNRTDLDVFAQKIADVLVEQ
jgi:hypothetical protein